MQERIKQQKFELEKIVLQFHLGYFQDIDFIYSTMKSIKSDVFEDPELLKLANNLNKNLYKFKKKANALLYIISNPYEYNIKEEHLDNIDKFINMYGRIKTVYHRCIDLCNKRKLEQHSKDHERPIKKNSVRSK